MEEVGEIGGPQNRLQGKHSGSRRGGGAGRQPLAARGKNRNCEEREIRGLEAGSGQHDRIEPDPAVAAPAAERRQKHQAVEDIGDVAAEDGVGLLQPWEERGGGRKQREKDALVLLSRLHAHPELHEHAGYVEKPVRRHKAAGQMAQQPQQRQRDGRVDVAERHGRAGRKLAVLMQVLLAGSPNQVRIVAGPERMQRAGIDIEIPMRWP